MKCEPGEVTKMPQLDLCSLQHGYVNECASRVPLMPDSPAVSDLPTSKNSKSLVYAYRNRIKGAGFTRMTAHAIFGKQVTGL